MSMPTICKPQRGEAPVRKETISTALVKMFEHLGVEHAFGIGGGAIVPFVEALASSRMRVVHCRHEAGAAFAAVEASFAGGRPALVFTTTGPGLLNALTGLSAARWEGAKVVLVAGATSAPQRGRWACQETSSLTVPAAGVLSAGPIFDYAFTLENAGELDTATRRLAMGFARPSGFVAHIGLPLAQQKTPIVRPHEFPHVELFSAGCERSSVIEHARLLEGRSVAIWLGFGARGAAPEIRALAEMLRAPVMCSPRAKGVFPEDHPLFLGVTGLGGHAGVQAHLHKYRPDYILVLGTRLGELTSFWQPDFTPGLGFIHVDLDPTAPGAAYPDVSVRGIQAEIGAFVRALLAELSGRHRPPEPVVTPRPSVRLPARTGGPVRSSFLMQEIQRIVVDASDAVVMTEAGNALAWGNHLLRFNTPGRYRVSTGYGAMGHFTAGVLGATLARSRPAVAIVGDGAMLMNNEVSTAVAQELPAIWIVLNDSRYGMIHQGMTAQGAEPAGTELPATDFSKMADAMGARGIRVEREDGVADALDAALADGGPVVVDIEIDREEVAPHWTRTASIMVQRDQSLERRRP